jgi:FHA domain-containing protein
MSNAKLTIKTDGEPEREVRLSAGVSIGRASDNSVHIPVEGVSRYHAIIEQRADGFWLSDLDSRNGTTLNGARLAEDKKLQDRDSIVLGGMATLEFHSNGAQPAVPTPNGQLIAVSDSPPRGETAPRAQGVQPHSPGSGRAMLIGLAIVVVIVFGFIIARLAWSSGGDNTSRPDGNTQAGAGRQETPKTERASEIKSSESRAAPVTTSAAEEAAEKPDGRIARPTDFEIASMSRNLAGFIVGKSGSGYVFAPAFLAAIRNHTDEYRVDMRDKVPANKFQINKAFRSSPLHVVTGYLLAISRSRFKDEPDGSGGIGFWRVPRAIALDYKAPEDPEAVLNDRERSAEIAAQYFKSLINVFGGDDFMYAIACFGMTTARAGDVKRALDESDPNDRRNFWAMVDKGSVPRDGADRVVRFFAAGVVAENPPAFGIESRALSWLIAN